MDDTIEFWDYDEDFMVIPRGYAHQVAEGFASFGYQVIWDDQRTVDPRIDFAPPIPVYPYQQKIVDAVIKGEQGIVVAPTGAGKTVAALEVFRRLGGNALVIVNTKEILQQWMDRVNQWLGESYPIDMVGDGVYTVGGRGDRGDPGQPLVEGRGADRGRVLQALPDRLLLMSVTTRLPTPTATSSTSSMRRGASACRPRRTRPETLSLLRPSLATCWWRSTTMRYGDKTIKPSVEVIETTFGAKYKSWRSPRGIERNNYQTILKQLSEDDDRNELIAGEIVNNHPDNANLVLSKRLKHLSEIEKALRAAGFPHNDIYWLTGKESREERKRVVELIEDGSCVVLSTLADEALDAPRLDRVHICFPTANGKLLIQQVGRIRRRHPDKTDAKIIDYWDRQVGPFNKNYLTRRHEVYDLKGFKVYKRKDSK